MLIAKKIHKTFKSNSSAIQVLKDINFSVLKGSWVSIVGPSGSGKTTLLHIISGLLEPDSGKVYFNDSDVYQKKENERSDFRRKNIGFVFQDFKLLPYYSVLDNVILPLFYDHKKDELYRRGEELLQMVGIDESLFSRLPEGLSSGEKQRAAIARSLMAEPDILICDEPTGNLDEESRDHIINLFTELKRQGKTIVLVTHDMVAAKQGDEIYHLIRGGLSSKEVDV